MVPELRAGVGGSICMTAAYFRERAQWCAALARQISDSLAADKLRIDAAAYMVRADRVTFGREMLVRQA
jgi:hypothetical protein